MRIPTRIILEQASRFRDKGYFPIPLAPNSKRPAYSGWPDIDPADIGELLTPGCGLGIHTRNVVAVDVDDKGQAREFCKTYRQRIRCINETRRGCHFLLRPPDAPIHNAVGVVVEGIRFDIRTVGGFIVAPPTEIDGYRYHFAPGYALREIDRLEVLPDELIPPKKEIQPVQIAPAEPADRRVLRGRLYISKIHAVAGSGGHNATFRAVCKLRDFGLTRAEAWQELLLWNSTNAVPPWKVETELWHKLNSVYK